MKYWSFIVAAEALGLVSLAAMAYGLVFERKGRLDRQSRWFLSLVGVLFAGECADMVAWACPELGWGQVTQLASACVAYAMTPVVIALFVYYVIAHIHVVNKRVSMLFAHVPSALLFVCFALVAVGFFTGDFTSAGTPARWLAATLLIASSSACVYLIGFILVDFRRLGAHDAVALLTYCILLLVGNLVEAALPELGIGYLSANVAMMILAEMLQTGYSDQARRDVEALRIKTAAAANFEAMEKALRILESENSLEDPRTFLSVVRDRFGALYCYLSRLDAARRKMRIDRRCATVSVLPGDYWERDCDELSDDILQRKTHDLLKLDAAQVEDLRVRYGSDFEWPVEVRAHCEYEMPLFIGGKPWGTLGLAFAEDRPLGEFEVNNLRRLVEILEIAYVRTEEINAQKQARANFVAMERVLRLLQAEDSLENLRPFLDVVRKRFEASNCSIAKIDRETKKATIDLERETSGMHEHLAPGDRGWEMSIDGFGDLLAHLARGEIVELDTADSQRLMRAYGLSDETVARLAVTFILVVPVFVRHELRGVLNIQFNTHPEFGEFHRENLLRLSEVLGTAIERSDSHQALQVALAEAKSAELAKATFLATMSHEIRTPLNAVVGFAEFLQNPDLTEKDRKSYLSGITRSSNALLSLINDILDLSKIEAGKMELRGGQCNLRRLFMEMKAIFRFRVEKKGLKFRYGLAENFPLLALQEERVRQILLNLIGNAAKFTQKGHVVFTAEYKDGSLSLNVQDTGCGIAPDMLEHVFNPYTQSASVRGGRVYHGTGLGLAICRRLVESVGGTVSVESEAGKGSLFKVVIPNVEVVDAGSLQTIDAPAGAIKPLSPEFVAPLHVVLVDDVAMNLKILTKFVEMIGVSKKNILSFEDPVKALEAVRAFGNWDSKLVVFTDMWMPEMTGEEFARRLREDVKTQRIPVIAVTADADTAHNFDMSYFDAVVAKPATSAKIRETLQVLLSPASNMSL